MASFKLNLATITNCPAIKDLAEALEEYALPEAEEFGVLNCTAGESAVFATVLRKTQQAIQRLDAKSGEVLTDAVEKVAVYPIGVFPKKGLLEVYEGPATAIEQIGAFFASGLALPTVVSPIDLDIPAAVDKLRSQAEHFQLKSIRVSQYAHDSYMAGPYAPKFLDSEHGMDFLREYVDSVTAASCRFRTPNGQATVTLSPKACFRYSLSNEDDQPAVQAVLRKLI
ncbi:MAG: hypothetical protein JW849_06115 [Phycisphaerae bacterium]|nr:hypothetical protein [Phycisphaerae bacterium]